MNDLNETLKLAMDSLKNRTLGELLKNDKDYQERVEEEKKAYCQFQKLDLTEEQKGIIDIVFARKEDVFYDYNINAYMAGMLDAYEILKIFGLTNE